MKQLERVLLDLNSMRRSSLLCSEYQATLAKVLEMQAVENEHEKQLAEIEAQRPVLPPPEQQKTIITYNEADGLRIEHPHREYFTIGQRFILTIFKWAAVILVVVILAAR